MMRTLLLLLVLSVSVQAQSVLDDKECEIDRFDNYSEAYITARDQDRPMLVLFGADWCGPCKMLKAAIKTAQQQKRVGRCVVVFVDVDKEPVLFDKFLASKDVKGRREVPQLFFLEGCNKRGRVMSPATSDGLQRFLDSVIPKG